MLITYVFEVNKLQHGSNIIFETLIENDGIFLNFYEIIFVYKIL